MWMQTPEMKENARNIKSFKMWVGKLAIDIKKEIQRRKSILMDQCWQDRTAGLLLYIEKKMN